ncbi:MAG: TIGR00730 family Rossman fold protein [Candidatus Dormibacteraeota bacterium]|nr:TIGR00730 family Rossman fold protein [Candidatus Dormibacteraeota bacterium]MBO0744440.1 TIGR00730 family Rossman fold protein [Candidatus Dormibacteraeota bacterium]
MTRVCIFCGAGVGRRHAYRAAAEEVGRELVRRGWGLVYGGGDRGLMGAVAGAVRSGGGEVVGIIPRGLVDVELAADEGLAEAHAELRVVSSMHERKALMEEMADAFCVLPGGLGTLEELVEVLSWAQLGLHQKPIGLLDVEGYYQPLLRLLDHAVREGFLPPEHRQLLLVETEPARLLDLLSRTRPPAVRRVISPEER